MIWKPVHGSTAFDWIRGYHVGGRSLMWGKQTYRLSDLDFEANVKEGIGVDWPSGIKTSHPGTTT